MLTIPSLIFDRTENDVDYIKELKIKIDLSGWNNTFLEDKTIWLGALKGRYDVSDQNRIETAVEVLKNNLISKGYNTAVSTTKIDWAVTDILNITEQNRHLANIQAIRDVLPVFETTPNVPLDMRFLNYLEANDIEKILYDVNILITNIEQTYKYCGDTICNGGDL